MASRNEHPSTSGDLQNTQVEEIVLPCTGAMFAAPNLLLMRVLGREP